MCVCVLHVGLGAGVGQQAGVDAGEGKKKKKKKKKSKGGEGLEAPAGGSGAASSAPVTAGGGQGGGGGSGAVVAEAAREIDDLFSGVGKRKEEKAAEVERQRAAAEVRPLSPCPCTLVKCTCSEGGSCGKLAYDDFFKLPPLFPLRCASPSCP